MNGWRLLGIIALSIAIPGGIWIGIGAYLLTKMSYSLAGVKLTSLSQNGVGMSLGLKIENPSEIAVDVLRYDLTFYINDKIVAKAKSDAPSRIEKSAGSVLSIPFTANFSQAFDAIGQAQIMTYFLRKEYDKITLSVEGSISARAVKIPMDYSIKKDEWTWTLADIFKMMNENKNSKNGQSK